MEGQERLAVRTSRKLVHEDRLKVAYPPVLLRQMLDDVLAPLWEDGYVTVREVWEAFARYAYLPRLRDIDVLIETVRQGPASMNWQAEGFATAAAVDDGKYLDLVGGFLPATVNTNTLVVKPAVAVEQLERIATVGANGGAAYMTDEDTVTTDAPQSRRDTQRFPTRFYGRVTLDPIRYARDFGQVQQEVLTHLSGHLGTETEIVVEIRATSKEGFDETTVRNIAENARTLKFDHHEFE